MLRETIAISAMLCALVPALLPLAEAGMPATHDGFLHVQRLIALEAVARQGAPFTRWLPDLAYGYGQPLLLYYAPLAYLPALAVRFLGSGFATSIEVASGLALVLSALTMYLLARSFVGPVAACAAAAVYGLMPYQLVDVYVRGALAESWAFVWLPLGAWCLLRAWHDGRGRWSVGLALSVAGLVLTHNVTALLFLPALAVLAIVLWIGDGARARDIRWAPLAGLGLGLVLSAWFWLPAIAERGLVQINETIEPDLFASFFLRSWPPFQPGLLFDYQRPVSIALGTPIYWPRLGLVQVLVTLAGIVAALRTQGSLRRLAIWATLLVVGGMLLQASGLARVYDLVPLLAFVQFPWRLLALVGLGSAILAAVVVEAASPRTDIRATFAGVMIAASLATAVGRLQPETTPVDEAMLSTETIHRIELADWGLGTTHSGEYLPASSGQRNANRFKKTMLEAGGGSQQAQGRPSSLRVERVDWRPDRVTLEVDAAAADRLVLHQFAFPGWSAWVDGVPVATSGVGEIGLLGLDVPAGRHTVEVAWGLTPLRTGAAALSLLGVVVLALLASGRVWPLQPRTLMVGVGVAGAFAACTLPGWSFLAPARGDQRTESVGSRAVGDGLMLADAQIDTTRLGSDRLVLVRTIWQVLRPPTGGYRSYVEVVTPDGQVLHRAPWVYEPESRLWARGEIVPTTVAVRLPSSVPGGTYQWRLAFEQPAGTAPVVLKTLSVPGSRSASLGVIGEGATVGADLRVGVPPGRNGGPPAPLEVKAGRSLDVPLRWEALGATPNVGRELLVVAVLSAPGGEILSEPRRPGEWFTPLPFWQAGEVVDQWLRLDVPPNTPTGPYPLTVRVYARDLARGGASESGASAARPRGQPVAELSLGDVTVTR